jgi:rfaE bifunctional protein kinase chain/domain
VTAFAGVTAATPNLEEAEEVIGRRLEQGATGDSALEEAGKRLIAKMGSRGVLITRGAAGMTLVEDGVRIFNIPAFGAGEVADVTGAGDTVIAVFTLALACGATMRTASLLANCAAGLVVMKRGTATVSAVELTSALERLDVPS